MRIRKSGADSLDTEEQELKANLRLKVDEELCFALLRCVVSFLSSNLVRQLFN